MIALEPITAKNAPMFKAVRLRALRDAPMAFGSTYAKESQLTDAEWIKRAAQWNGERSVGFLAMDEGDRCGIAASFLDQSDATRAHIVSVWTAPSHRRQGVARLLLQEILGWARRSGAQILQLMVTSNNQSALSSYQGQGFTLTGRTEPYPNDSALIELEMSTPIAGDSQNRSKLRESTEYADIQ
jgi:ribosomal protein S18 acetylase RimI-like enzyme